MNLRDFNEDDTKGQRKRKVKERGTGNFGAEACGASEGLFSNIGGAEESFDDV